MKGIDALNRRCTQIADRVVPAYRDGRKSYSCTGGVAKRWQAAWDSACIALGYDPKEVMTAEKEVMTAKKGGKAT